MALTLDAWRRARNITQQEMADKLGIHVNTYRYWEDHQEGIKIESACALAEILEVSIGDINFSSTLQNVE